MDSSNKSSSDWCNSVALESLKTLNKVCGQIQKSCPVLSESAVQSCQLQDLEWNTGGIKPTNEIVTKTEKGAQTAQGNKSSLGAHSRAVLTTARAAAPKATVRPITASRTKRRVAEGRATTEFEADFSSAACLCLRLRRRTESGRCWVDARSKSLKVELAMLWEKRNRKYTLFQPVSKIYGWASLCICKAQRWSTVHEKQPLEPVQMEGTGQRGLQLGWSVSRREDPEEFETVGDEPWPCRIHNPAPHLVCTVQSATQILGLILD